MSAEQRIVVLGDIHANDAALAAVLAASGDAAPTLWFLGDLFGRGPRPALVYRRLMAERPEAMIIGNHEGGLVGHYHSARFGDQLSGLFNPADWQVLMAHRTELCAQELLSCTHGVVDGGEVFDFINDLPVICAPRPTIYMVHGGLERPFAPPDDLQTFYDRLVWEYVRDSASAEYTLAAMNWVAAHRPADRRIVLPPGDPVAPELVLVGHWHARLLYDQASGVLAYPPELGKRYPLGRGPVLLSPGSVGFPRENGNLDASYCVLTLREDRPVSVEFRTCAYDRRAVRDEMARKEYPEATVKRLRLPGETELVTRAAGRSAGQAARKEVSS